MIGWEFLRRCDVQRPMRRRLLLCVVTCIVGTSHVHMLSAQTVPLRVASFNVSFNRCEGGLRAPCLDGGMQGALASPNYRPGRQVAEILQRVRPDVVLLNEFNFDATGATADLFQTNFLSIGQDVSGADTASEPIEYPYRYLAPVNTGVASGFDLDNNGTVATELGTGAYGNDAFGFGEFPGRYGMLVLSQYPIMETETRTFQQFLWKDMPGALLPDDPSTPEAADWYSAEELEVFRLSSKSHWDVVVDVGGTPLHVLASHPTPPVFDGAEDRNGRRNSDEIRLWADYITPDSSDYIVDDQGRRGGLAADAPFVIMGDLNSDPLKGDSRPGSIAQLLDHPRVNSEVIPETPRGGTDTSTFGLRVDYVLPSTNLDLAHTEIFWPSTRVPEGRLVSSSDHRMVWADVAITVPEPVTPSWWCFACAAALARRSRRQVTGVTTALRRFKK